MLTVATVLRSGGEYRPEHVTALRAQIAARLTLPHRFVCLSDGPWPGCGTVALQHDWPGWWSKIELFRHGLFDGPVLYFDLDTMITGPLDDLAIGHQFTVLENFWTPGLIGSALMAWDAGAVDLSPIYRAFRADPKRAMAEYVTREKFGDQGFIDQHTPVQPALWQQRFPGRVVSYRRHCADGVPKAASIVCFGGKARPWNSRVRPALEA